MKEIDYATRKDAYFKEHNLKHLNAVDEYKWETEEDGEKKVMKDWKENMKRILDENNKDAKATEKRKVYQNELNKCHYEKGIMPDTHYAFNDAKMMYDFMANKVCKSI